MNSSTHFYNFTAFCDQQQSQIKTYVFNYELLDIYKDNKIDQIDIEFMKKELLKVN